MNFTLNLWVVIISCLGASFTKVFFWLLELQNPKLEAQGVVAYQSARQFALSSSPGSGLFQYLAFRILPNALSAITTIGLASKFELLSPQDLVCAGAIATFLGNSGTLFSLFRSGSGSNVRLLHLLVILLVLLTNALILLIHVRTDFLKMAFPDLSSLRDSLWAALLTALVVALYLRTLLMSRSDSADNYVPDGDKADTGGECTRAPWKSQFELIRVRSANRTAGNLASIIEESSRTHQLPTQLMSAIIVFESLNRPKHIRQIENLLVRIPGIELTVGPAQIRSSRPLSDQESITILAARMAHARDRAIAEGLSGQSIIEAILRDHNQSNCFLESVLDIYWNFMIQ